MARPRRALRSDGEETRARLLESAGELFAANGYGETTGKAIAAHAAADLASINYHFGGRDALYRAVLIEAHRRIVSRDALEEIAALDLPAPRKLRMLLDMLVSVVVRTEHWSSRVLLRELASPSSHFVVLRQNEVLPKLGIVLSLISEITGIPMGEPALFHCFLSTAAPCAMLIMTRGALIPEGMPPLAPELLADHLHRFAMAGLDAAAKHHAAARAGAEPPAGS
ncbi:CerR family C-terminal domain-containing protein [Sphingomonas colocasiae]|nr:CerR family C-terminal domain-containing protein [Sphingomonas colocasiae]